VRFAALLSGKSSFGKLAALAAAPPLPGQLSATTTTFVRLRPGAFPDRLAARFPAFALAHYPSADGSKPLFASLYLNPLADLHLYPFNPDTNERDARVQTLLGGPHRLDRNRAELRETPDHFTIPGPPRELLELYLA
jgi:hypothetical protein